VGYRFSLLIAIASVSALACGSSPSPPAAALAGAAPAPVVTLSGEPTDVANAAHGRVALVSLWAPWCDGCERELDALNRLDARTASSGDAVVIGVAVGEPRAAIADFVHRRGLRYMQLVDEEFRFADSIGERRVPATLVLDRAGRIVYRGKALDAGSLDALHTALDGHAGAQVTQTE
jgi:peroxiredoxin